MSHMGVNIGTQIHAIVLIKVSNTLQHGYHEIDNEINFLSFEATK